MFSECLLIRCVDKSLSLLENKLRFEEGGFKSIELAVFVLFLLLLGTSEVKC